MNGVHISQRQKEILFAVIGEYIKNAQPVSSSWIAESSDFDVSPATLRNELAFLEAQNFIYQPHTSAGRVPTDKGYRFFVNTLSEEMELRRSREAALVKILQQIIRHRAEEHALFAELGKTLAALSESTVFSGPLNEDKIMFKAGIHEVLAQPELEDVLVRRNFGDIVDSLETHLKMFYSLLEDNKPTVFIGRENPLNGAKDFSMIIAKHKVFSGDEGIIVIFGPKRMNYRRNLKLLKTLTE